MWYRYGSCDVSCNAAVDLLFLFFVLFFLLMFFLFFDGVKARTVYRKISNKLLFTVKCPCLDRSELCSSNF